MKSASEFPGCQRAARANSTEQGGDRPPLTHAERAALAVADLGVRGHAHRLVNCGQQVFWGDRALAWVGARAVAGAVDLAAADAAPGQQRRVTRAPVLAPLRIVDARRAA